MYGQLSRTAWLDAGIENYPRASSNGYLYNKKMALMLTVADDNVFIESSDFDIGDGEQFTFIRRIIPDFKFIQNTNKMAQ